MRTLRFLLILLGAAAMVKTLGICKDGLEAQVKEGSKEEARRMRRTKKKSQGGRSFHRATPCAGLAHCAATAISQSIARDKIL